MSELEHQTLLTATGRTRRNLFALVGVFSAAWTTKAAAIVVCFLRGTNIRVPDGECAVENLKIGDLVITLSGEAKPIKWIGRQRFKKAPGKAWVAGIEPIRVARHALDAVTPHRDLFISRGHALYLDQALVPVGSVVNGRSIAPKVLREVDTIEYFHVELFAHDVIYAEGAPVESLAAGNRERFDNFVEYERLYRSEPRAEMALFAPILSYNGSRSELRSRIRSAASPWIDKRSKLDKIRDRLAERAELSALAAGR
jgi:hypothetical protein